MNDKKQTLAYKVGQALAVLVAVCFGIAAVALTVRFVLWLF